MLKIMQSGCYKPYVLALTLSLINDLQQVTYSLSTSDDSSEKGRNDDFLGFFLL